MTDFAELAKRMKELNLQRDQPFATPLAPTWETELAEKILPKPMPNVVDEWYGGC